MLIGRMTFALAAAMALGTAATAFAEGRVEAQSAAWRPHHAKFDYFGITSRYSCDGMEDKVRSILLYFGAGPDLQVRAVGCPGGANSVSRNIWVTADFSTLAEVPAETQQPATTRAAWKSLTLQAKKPYFMDDGDCELIDQMRKLLSDGFSWRGPVRISASCPPHTVEINDYRVQGEVLRAVSTPKG